MSSAKTKSVSHPWGDDHPEKITQTGSNPSLKDQLKGLFNPSDQLRGLGPASFVEQIFGTPIGSSETQQQPEKQPRKPSIRKEFTIFSFETSESQRKLQTETHHALETLKQQIAVLEKKEKTLSQGISKITVEQVPETSVGIYFLRYIEWLISEVGKMIIRTDEATTWLGEFTKRKKKLGYWKMYKKHGTTFGMSNERTLATQAG